MNHSIRHDVFRDGDRSLIGALAQKNLQRWSHTQWKCTTWHRGPTKGYTQKKVPKAKSGFHQPYHKRQDNDHPKHNVLLDRLSLPSSPLSPPGTLLERIGGSVEDEAVLPALTDVDRIDGDHVSSEGTEVVTDSPFSTAPHYYTPEPGEVERFLESVIGILPPLPIPSSPPGPVHACLGNKPTLALETNNLPVDRRVTVDGSSSSVLYSPTQTAVNSLPSAHLSPLLGDTLMPPPSAATLGECKKNLIPVLLASTYARDPGKRLDSDQCHGLLSDDHCTHLFRQAKEMRHQLASRVSQKTPMDQGWSGSLKRDRVDDVDAWVRNTRSRFNSVNTVVSDVSRRDSDITLVDFPGARLPPKAPRAMLQASQAQAAFINKSLDDRLGEAPYKGLVASPTAEDHPTSATSLIELVQQAIKMFPALMPTNEPVTEVDTSNAPVGMSTSNGDHPSQVVKTSANSTNFVSHLPTQPGIWFKQQGRQHAEIVDVNIDVSDEMFIISRERLPFRLRMHLRLCSVPVSAVAQDNGDDTLLSQNVDSAIERRALHWPKKGKLVVQVNPESERSQTWLPYTLESDALDVTSCMRPGKNTFRFIQLSDLSEFTFVLAASVPLPEDAWRSWDWATLARSPSSSSTDDSMNGLSEFARIPVTIRS